VIQSKDHEEDWRLFGTWVVVDINDSVVNEPFFSEEDAFKAALDWNERDLKVAPHHVEFQEESL